jgi:hypothetical protein
LVAVLDWLLLCSPMRPRSLTGRQPARRKPDVEIVVKCSRFISLGGGKAGMYVTIPMPITPQIISTSSRVKIFP